MINKEENEIIVELLKQFDIIPSNLNLYLQALTHASYSNEHKNSPSYDRLEFLGDSILDMVVADLLFSEYPNANSGSLSKMRSALVQGEMLTYFSEKSFHLADYVRYSVGEKDNIRFHKHIDEDVFEALIGAIYLDQGYECCRNVLKKIYEPLIHTADNFAKHIDSKGTLQEIMGTNIAYIVVSQKNINSPDVKFQVHAKIGNQILGIGEGRTIKEAEINAANDALRKKVGD